MAIIDNETGEILAENLGQLLEDRVKINEILTRPFEGAALKTRTGGGNKEFTYISTDTCIRRLNEATNNHWSFEIVHSSFLDALPRKDRGGNVVSEQKTHLVHGRLTIPDFGVRDGLGVQVVDWPIGVSVDLLKAAPGDALKRAAVSFGVAIDLYGKDLEHLTAVEAAAQPARPPQTSAPSPQAAQRPQRTNAAPAASQPASQPSGAYPYAQTAFDSNATTKEVVDYMWQNGVQTTARKGGAPDMFDAIVAANKYGKETHGVERIVIGTGEPKEYKGRVENQVRPMDIGNAVAHYFEIESKKPKAAAPAAAPAPVEEEWPSEEEVPF